MFQLELQISLQKRKPSQTSSHFRMSVISKRQNSAESFTDFNPTLANIWAVLIMLSVTSEVLSALFDTFYRISIHSEEFPPQSAEKNEMVSLSTHKNVFWTCGIREESREKTGNDREQDWAGFFCSDFCIKLIWAHDTIIGSWKQTKISLKKIMSLYKH